MQIRRQIEPFLVEHGQGVLDAGIGNAEMDFPGTVNQAAIFPPAFSGQIEIAFIGPASYSVDIVGLTGTGRPGNHELPEFQADRQLDPADVLDLFDRLEYLVQRIFHLNV